MTGKFALSTVHHCQPHKLHRDIEVNNFADKKFKTQFHLLWKLHLSNDERLDGNELFIKNFKHELKMYLERARIFSQCYSELQGSRSLSLTFPQISLLLLQNRRLYTFDVDPIDRALDRDLRKLFFL